MGLIMNLEILKVVKLIKLKKTKNNNNNNNNAKVIKFNQLVSAMENCYKLYISAI